MRHRLRGLYGLNGLSKGDEHPAYAPGGALRPFYQKEFESSWYLFPSLCLSISSSLLFFLFLSFLSFLFRLLPIRFQQGSGV